jgi:predicted nucleic acid-binding protein
MIVVDANVMIAALVDQEAKGSAARKVLIADPRWTAPAHMPLEVVRTLQRYERAGGLPVADIERYVATLGRVHGRWIAPDAAMISLVWRLRHNVAAYDAAYLAVAQMTAARLVTFDLRLAKAASGIVSVIIP